MNLIKITTMLKMNLFGVYDIKRYKMPATSQLAFAKYAIDAREIILNEEK